MPARHLVVVIPCATAPSTMIRTPSVPRGTAHTGDPGDDRDDDNDGLTVIARNYQPTHPIVRKCQLPDRKRHSAGADAWLRSQS